MTLNGARIVVECLKEQSVDTVFGYPGGKVIPLYDALYDSTGEVRHILTAHEQGASHAADGYARVTGGWAYASRPRVPDPPISSPASPRPTWTLRPS